MRVPWRNFPSAGEILSAMVREPIPYRESRMKTPFGALAVFTALLLLLTAYSGELDQ